VTLKVDYKPIVETLAYADDLRAFFDCHLDLRSVMTGALRGRLIYGEAFIPLETQASEVQSLLDQGTEALLQNVGIPREVYERSEFGLGAIQRSNMSRTLHHLQLLQQMNEQLALRYAMPSPFLDVENRDEQPR
jgi:hypothetical protein